MRLPLKPRDQGVDNTIRRYIYWLRPSYDETALFLTALASILILLRYRNYGQMINLLFSGSPSKVGIAFLGLVIFAIFGFCLSIYHVFSTREKETWEKTAMATFAMLASGGSGIAIGIEMLKDSRNGLIAFPLVNIFTGIFLLYQIGLNPEKSVDNEQAKFCDIVFGSLVLIGIFILGQAFLNLSGPAIFSICITYSISIHHLIRQIVGEIKILIKPTA